MFNNKVYYWILFTIGIAIVIFTVYSTHRVSTFIASNERRNVKLWADAIHRRAEIVENTEMFYREMEAEDRRRVNLLANTFNNIISTPNDIAYYLDIIENNKTIPVVLTDEDGNIKSTNNVDFDTKSITKLEDDLKEEYSQYSPIKVQYYRNQYDLLYYKESRLFTELRVILDSLNRSFLDEIVRSTASMPVVITDSTKKNIIATNFRLIGFEEPVAEFIDNGAIQEPLVVDSRESGKYYVFYRESPLLSELTLFPFLQLGIIGLFILAVYILVTSARKSKEDRVWVGMSRETAHQLGTPISSMLGWIELLRLKHETADEINELDEITKDVSRLEVIAERFSKIGSMPKLVDDDIVKCINRSISYLKARTSKKMIYTINTESNEIIIPFNINLMEWVIENITKNAIDAMNGEGYFTIDISTTTKNVIIDFTDTGKGLNKRDFKRIFHPGYTTKTRGWGLGLSLAKRIINTYHGGNIYVKQSVINKGTTIRIILKK